MVRNGAMVTPGPGPVSPPPPRALDSLVHRVPVPGPPSPRGKPAVHPPRGLGHRYVQCSVLNEYSLTCPARRGHSLTSTSHLFDGELDQLAAEMGCKGGNEKGGNGLGLGQTVQACLPPIPRGETNYRSDHVTLTGPTSTSLTGAS